MATSANVAPAGGFTRWMRYALIGVAFTFVIGGVVQFFLAGLAVFDVADSPSHWSDHVDMGRRIGFLAYLMPVLALLGRVGIPRIGHALVVTILFIVQTILANVDTSWIAALHPLNGLLLIGAASSLGGRTIELLRPHGRGESTPVGAVGESAPEAAGDGMG